MRLHSDWGGVVRKYVFLFRDRSNDVRDLEARRS